jgi:hypothetical protein
MSTHQSDRFDVLELDVGDSLEPPGLVAENEPDVSDLADGREELVDIARAAPLRKLHHEDRASVALFRSHRQLRRSFADRRFATGRTRAATIT